MSSQAKTITTTFESKSNIVLPAISSDFRVECASGWLDLELFHKGMVYLADLWDNPLNSRGPRADEME
jgi:hypothetical protein